MRRPVVKKAAGDTSNRKPPLVMTIGHSTRSLQELIDMLGCNGVKLLVDVRTVPKSRTNPQFNTDNLSRELPEHGIKYVHMPALGGLRHARKDSPNTVWENASFRGYADYMESDTFRQAVAELVHLASRQQVAIMCSEAVWWRCHRSMIADELVAQGIPVDHIMSGTKRSPHSLRSFAHVEDNHVSYRQEQ